MMQNHPIVKEVGLEDVYQHQTYTNYKLPLIVYIAWMQNQSIVKKVGLEDVYQYQTYSNL